MTERYIDEAAPVPYGDGRVPRTAEALLRYLAADGTARAAVGVDLLPPPLGEHGERDWRAELLYRVNVERLIHSHDVYLLLSELRAYDAAKADEMADRLITAAEAGDSYGEWLWEWCTRHGMDADRIAAEARAALEREGRSDG